MNNYHSSKIWALGIAISGLFLPVLSGIVVPIIMPLHQPDSYFLWVNWLENPTAAFVITLFSTMAFAALGCLVYFKVRSEALPIGIRQRRFAGVIVAFLLAAAWMFIATMPTPERNIFRFSSFGDPRSSSAPFVSIWLMAFGYWWGWSAVVCSQRFSGGRRIDNQIDIRHFYSAMIMLPLATALIIGTCSQEIVRLTMQSIRTSQSILRKTFEYSWRTNSNPITIALNPNCPPDILRQLAQRKSGATLYYLAINPNTPDDVVAELLQSSEISDRDKVDVAKSPFLPSSRFETFMQYGSEGVRQAVSARINHGAR